MIRLPTPAANAPAPAAAGDGDRGERQEPERVLGEHPAAPDRQCVGLVLELAGGADRAEQRVPAGDRAAGDRDEQHRPEWLERPAGVPVAKPLKASSLKSGRDAAGASMNGARIAPIALTPMTIAVIQKPM